MLTIDIGNSRVKWALLERGIMREHGSFSYKIDSLKKDLIKADLPRSTEVVEVSCVAGPEFKKHFISLMNKNAFTNLRFAETKANQRGVVNSYEVPENTGVDRWLAMIEAFRLSDAAEGEVVCVIDCGTAITLDVINNRGRHLGGLIMPGYRTMINSLVSGTGNIKFSEKNHNDIDGAGMASSTQGSISKGCSQLITAGLSSIIDTYVKHCDIKVHCIVTGGDGEWVSKAIEYESCYNPFLVLQGLYTVSTETDNRELTI